MKAYLIRNAAALPPFHKPASWVRLHDSTVGSRLRAQLAEIGCEVVDVDALDRASIAPGSLAVQDDLVVSSRLLRTFVSAIPDRRRSYQCEIDTTRFTFTCLSEVDAPTAYRTLPLHYVGDDRNAQAEPLRMIPRSVHELAQELPARVDQITDMRAYVIDYYGIQLEHWFDLLTASSLYCREYVADAAAAIPSCPSAVADDTCDVVVVVQAAMQLDRQEDAHSPDRDPRRLRSRGRRSHRTVRVPAVLRHR